MNRDNETLPSIFAPRSVEDVGERLDRLLKTPCQCDDNTHLNILHDLAEDDVPWLIRKLRMVEAERNELRNGIVQLRWSLGYRLDVEQKLNQQHGEMRQERDQLAQQIAEIRQIAFDPDTVSALERGAIGCPPNVDGLSLEAAIGYGVDALRDIRAVLGDETA